MQALYFNQLNICTPLQHALFHTRYLHLQRRSLQSLPIRLDDQFGITAIRQSFEDSQTLYALMTRPTPDIHKHVDS